MDNETKSMTSLVMGIVIVAVFLVVGIYIQSTLDTALDTDNTAGAAVNESVTVASLPTGATLTAAALRNGVCGTITAVYNGTAGVLIAAANYTQDGCVLTNATATTPWGTVWLVNYPYSYSSSTNASAAAADSVDALSSGTPWLTIIVVVGFAVIVLGFLTSGFKESTGTPGVVY